MAAQWMKERFDVNWKEKKKVWCVLKSKLSNFVKKKKLSKYHSPLAKCWISKTQKKF